MTIDIPYHTHIKSKKPKDHFLDNTHPDFDKPVAMGNTWIEKKSDGYRVTVSYDRSNTHEPIKLFSNNGIEWNPECFPEIVSQIKTFDRSFVMPCELRGYPTHDHFTKTDEYAAISNRPLHDASVLTKEDLIKRPLMLDAFDILRIEGTTFAERPLSDRRSVLESLIRYDTWNVQPIEHWDVTSPEELGVLYSSVVSQGGEGLIAKHPNSLYFPGTRNKDWLKLKDFTTLDLAVLGFHTTPDTTAKGLHFACALVGSYNPKTEQLETLSKINIPQLADQEKILSYCSMIPTGRDFSVVQEQADFLVNPRMGKVEEKKIPDYLAEGLCILEIRTMGITHSVNYHSCGLNGKAHSLRIPSFTQVRDDKRSLEDVTTTQQIQELYLG